MVGTTLRPLNPRERPGTHCTGGWVGPRAGLDVCVKSHPHRDFFFFVQCFICSYLALCCSGILLGADGFGRERTRDLGYQRPAC
jgi:hypothetical protein